MSLQDRDEDDLGPGIVKQPDHPSEGAVRKD